MNYHEFLTSKTISDPATGMARAPELTAPVFEFQRDIINWSLRRGRAAIFAGTGLGKSIMELSWADAVHMHTNKDVIIIAPLAVSAQLVREAQKFGIDARQVKDGADVRRGINITNYEKLDRFDLSNFDGVVLDESSILKNVNGTTRNALISACKNIPFRLPATATPSPNDFMELGNHAEFCGVMSYTDMLSTFFVHDGGETQKWRLKGHAEEPFWKWMSSWAVMLRKPSDLGYENGGYDLPPLHQYQHTVAADHTFDSGTLFPMQAQSLSERLTARRNTVGQRVDLAASITPSDRPFVWWCNLNSESDALVRQIKDAVEIRGSDCEDAKEEKILAFLDGQIQTLVTKASICGFGLNFQHCADTGFVGMTDSFEQVFQAVRRFWRFGQTKPVHAHFIAADTEGAVVANFRRKEADAERMADQMVKHMADLSAEIIHGAVRDRADYQPTEKMKLPSFLRGAA